MKKLVSSTYTKLTNLVLMLIPVTLAFIAGLLFGTGRFAIAIWLTVAGVAPSFGVVGWVIWRLLSLAAADKCSYCD